ncbi:hypothetical protein Gasu2_17690 [Galdieria sulphuraria]|uniref:Glycine-rich domain-containing protein n=1 Tax=Galdieria sulphuraria TaxID=130081 RepID=M2XR99_GALSU|nr:uncharacterized protein Gasu_63880 [Galdieria sulphuraria]EME25954.1 hypothetical protein Gasu_63880 [Galdieria sulphuraria]GJD07407.1 hypothetical protein Gasu2_17690 [Galdieria sulphuraria]|eukprot:XP_005702474.1 hypothetical protein Gasu_63880 [Galdieria sulphuraria]
MPGEGHRISHSFPGIYTVQVPKGPSVSVVFASKIFIENRTLYKVFSVRLTPPVNITADIPDCRETNLSEIGLKVNDVSLDTNFATNIFTLENLSSREEGRVYESSQGVLRILFQGYLEEGLLEPFFKSDSHAYFVTQVGKPRIEYKYRFDTPGVHTVKVPANVHNARSVVVGGGGGGGGVVVFPCFAFSVGGGGGGAGGTAFGRVTVRPEKELTVLVGEGGEGGSSQSRGEDGTGSTFLSLFGGGGEGGHAGPYGRGGTGGSGSGPTVEKGGDGSRGGIARGGTGGKPYYDVLYSDGRGGAGGSGFGESGSPGEAGLVSVIFEPSSSRDDLEHFSLEYQQLAVSCGLLSVSAEGPKHLYRTREDEL